LRWSRQLLRLPQRVVHNIVRNIFGGVASPTFGDIKCDDAHRFIELPFGDLPNDVRASCSIYYGTEMMPEEA